MAKKSLKTHFTTEFYESLKKKNYATLNPEEKAGDVWYFSQTGDIYLIACGATRRTSFSFDEILWEHEKALLDFREDNCRGMVALNYRNAAAYGRGRCFLIPIENYMDYQITCGLKSISMMVAEELGTECAWADDVWNVPI